MGINDIWDHEWIEYRLPNEGRFQFHPHDIAHIRRGTKNAREKYHHLYMDAVKLLDEFLKIGGRIG